MWVLLGFLLGSMVDPILIGAAIALHVFTIKLSTAKRFLLAVVIAIALGMLSRFLHGVATDEEGQLLILSFTASFIGFLIDFSIMHLIGMFVNKFKSTNNTPQT